MSTTYPGAIATAASAIVRTVTSADSSTINDTNFLPTDATKGAGWSKVALYPRFTAGTSPTMTIQILHRVTAVGGNGWMIGPKSAPLTEGEAFIVDVKGRDFYARVDTLTGTPTSATVNCAGWEPFNYDGPKGK